MPTSPRDELLRRVLADPADRALRAIYGDALLEAGDPRGELIAVELALEAAPSIALAQRRLELRREHGATWWPGLATQHVRTRGGFAHAVALDGAQMAQLAALCTREPIDELHTLGYGVTLAELPVEWPARLRRLTARLNEPHAIEAIAASALGDQLEAIDLSHSRMSDHSPSLGRYLPRCTDIRLADTVCRSWLLSWDHLERARAIDLSGCELDPHELSALLEPLRELRVLRLSRNPLEDTDAHRLAQAVPAWPALERLELYDCGISEDAAAELRAALPPRATLGIDPSDPSEVAIDFVGHTLRFTHLAGERWAASVDGIGYPIRFVRTISTSAGSFDEVATHGADAPLDDLALALRCGVRATSYDRRRTLQVSPLCCIGPRLTRIADLEISESPPCVMISITDLY